jgi:hypothetical protein
MLSFEALVFDTDSVIEKVPQKSSCGCTGTVGKVLLYSSYAIQAHKKLFVGSLLLLQKYFYSPTD